MTQRRSHSVAEVMLNTFSGFVVSYAAGFLIFPLVGFHPSPAQNGIVVGLYTIISLIRSYLWRRLFNWLQWKVF